MRRASPGGIVPPPQPVSRPWLQPGGVLALPKPRRIPELLSPRGVPMVRALLKPLPPEPRDIDMPPPIPPPPIPPPPIPPPPPPPRAKAGAATATAAATATTSVRALNRLFISAPFLPLLFGTKRREWNDRSIRRPRRRGDAIASRLEKLWPFYDQRLNSPQPGARVGPTRVAPPSTTSVCPVM